MSGAPTILDGLRAAYHYLQSPESYSVSEKQFVFALIADAEAALADLLAALKPFADAAGEIPAEVEDFKIVAHVPAGPHAVAFKAMNACMTAGDFRRVAKALAQAEVA